MLNETASDEASFFVSQKSLACVCSSQKSSSGGDSTGSIDVVNFTPDPPNVLLVDYGSSAESGDEQESPSRDAEAAVFDLGTNFGGDDATQDKTKSDETKAMEKREFRFKKPTEESALEELSRKTFSANTDRKIDWAVGLFKSW